MSEQGDRILGCELPKGDSKSPEDALKTVQAANMDGDDDNIGIGARVLSFKPVNQFLLATDTRMLTLQVGDETEQGRDLSRRIAAAVISVYRGDEEFEHISCIHFFYPTQRNTKTKADNYVLRSLIQQLLEYVREQVSAELRAEEAWTDQELEDFFVKLLNLRDCVVLFHGFPSFEKEYPDEANRLLQLFSSIPGRCSMSFRVFITQATKHSVDQLSNMAGAYIEGNEVEALLA